MNELEVVSAPEPAANDDCWNRIGVHGDASCPELTRVTHCRNCPVFARAGRLLFEREPPAEQREAWSAVLARQESQAKSDTVAALTFRLGKEWFAWSATALVEIAELRMIHAVPHRTNRLLLGLVNLRGELQLCVSLAELMAMPEPVAVETVDEATTIRLIVAEGDGRRWVFPVDEVAGVVTFDRRDEQVTPPTLHQGGGGFSRGVFPWRELRVAHLDHERVFAGWLRRMA